MPAAIVAIGVLKGAFLFHADLVRALADPALVVDFLEVRSYAGTMRLWSEVGRGTTFTIRLAHAPAPVTG